MSAALATVRVPRQADAPAVAGLWRRSIIELCFADHHGRPEIIAAWCESKTPGHLQAAFGDPNLHWILANLPDDSPVGIGLLSAAGVIMALYVHPEVVRRGVGSLLLSALTKEASARGLTRLELESTSTAHAFYLRHGFMDVRTPVLHFGCVRAFPMEKSLRD